MATKNPSLRDDLKGNGSWNSVAEQLNKLARMVGNMRGTNGVEVLQRSSEIVIDGTGASGGGFVDEFAITKINNSTLTVNVGVGYVASFGVSSAVAAQSNVSVGGTESSPQFIYISGSINPLTASICTAATASYPVSDDTTWRRVIWMVWVNNGAIVLQRARGIDLTSYYKPGT